MIHSSHRGGKRKMSGETKKLGGLAFLPIIAFLVVYIGAGLSYSPVSFMPYVWYSFLLTLFGILSIFVPFADGYIKKHPWNWEKGEAE